MDDSPSADVDSASQPSSTPWPLWLLLVVAVVILIFVRSRRGSDDRLLGRPLPPLEVAGWLNAPTPPTAASLRGQVVLVDCWATWCFYCVEEMPELVEFYHRYHDQGLVLIGLTQEVGDELPQVRSYVASVDGLDWPIGYGAMIALDMMGIEAVPTYVLYDRSGKSVWVGASLRGLEDAVVKALAAD